MLNPPLPLLGSLALLPFHTHLQLTHAMLRCNPVVHTAACAHGCCLSAVAVSTPHEDAAGHDILLGECTLEGAPLIMRCNTMPVQQAEAVEQLLRQVR